MSFKIATQYKTCNYSNIKTNDLPIVLLIKNINSKKNKTIPFIITPLITGKYGKITIKTLRKLKSINYFRKKIYFKMKIK